MPVHIPDKIPCDSLSQFEEAVKAFNEALLVVETEETWDKIEHTFTRFTAIVKGGGYKFEKELVNALKTSSKGFISAMTSERTRLAIAALECLGATAPRIGIKFEPLIAIFIPPLLRLSTRTNKVYITRSQATTALIIGYCQIPSIIPHLLTICKESKMATGRLAGAEATLRTLNKWDWTLKDTRAKVTDLEDILRCIGRDKDSAVRQTSKKVFEAYQALFPERVNGFAAPLTPTIRKYLGIKAPALDRPNSFNLSTSTSSVKPSASNALRLDLREGDARPGSQNSSSGVVAFPTMSKSVNNRPDGSMPPPAIVPSRPRVRPLGTSKKGPSPVPSEEDVNEVRQRVISNASSTFSVKSAPSHSHTVAARKPPIRLAVSQSGQDSTVVASGPARRIRRVISVEPHPANQSDLFAAARKVNGGMVAHPNPNGMGSKQAVDVALPRSDTGNPAVERKGAQRVLKPAQPPPASVGPKSSTEDAPKLANNAPAKRETKPSIFRRGAPGAMNKPPTEGNSEKSKVREGFVPRKGGITQPTLSQLNKQRTRVVSITAAKKPGVISKPSTLKATKFKGQSSKMQEVGKTDSAGDSRSITPHLVPLPSSPETTTSPEAKETSVQKPDDMPKDGITNEVQSADDLTTSSEPDSPHDQGQPAGDSPDMVQAAGHEEVPSLSSTPIQRMPAPRTPPFPGTDNADESHELDHIEFRKGDAYDSTGMPVKTPRKLEVQPSDLEDTVNRRPLGEVNLNE